MGQDEEPPPTCQVAASFLGATLTDDDTLRNGAAAGDTTARRHWIDRLIARADVDTLRAFEVLLERGHFTELVDRARQGDRHAGRTLRFHLDPPFDDNPENRLRP